MSEIIELSDESFEGTTKEGVTLVDFYADWCGPCRMLAPVIEEVANSMDGQAKFAKLDIDKHLKTASAMQVTSVPTMILFKDGKEVNRLVGLRDADGIRQFVGSA